MKIRNERTTFQLNAKGIDYFSEYLENMLEKIGIERQNRLRIRLSMEDALLNYLNRFGSDHQVEALISRKFGNPFVQIELEGEIYNPLNKIENELEDWSSSLLTSVGIHPQYSYSGNRNILRIHIPTPGMNPVLRILIAICVGILGGLLIRWFLPNEDANEIREMLFSPVFNLWFRMLNLISGPVIFFMVVTTMLGFGKMGGKGANSKRVLGRYFLITAMIATLTSVIVCLLMRMGIMGDQLTEYTVSAVLEEIFRIVPSDMLSPFISADTPQLILIAAVLGVMIHVLRDQAGIIVKVVRQINSICLLSAEWVSWMVPIFAAILLGLEIAGGKVRLLIDLWRPLLISIVLTVIVALLSILYTAVRKKVPVPVLLSKVWNPFFTALKAGSLSASYGLTEKYCSQHMGINREFTEVSLTHGLVLYMPANILGAIVVTVVAAARYQVRVTLIWFILAIILTAVLMEAAPPVPGVSLLVYMAVFSQLGIPDEALIPAMVFDIVFGIFSSAVNQMMLQFEMVHQADRIGLVNIAKLRASMND